MPPRAAVPRLARPGVAGPAAVRILAVAGQVAALILAAEAQGAVTTKKLRHAFFKGALMRRTMYSSLRYVSPTLSALPSTPNVSNPSDR